MRSLLLFLPLVGVNFWHAIVIYMARRKSGKLTSISESALASTKLLRTHQIVHFLGALCFMAFAIVSFDGIGAVAALLIVAAVLDVLQASLLSVKTDHSPLNLRDRHQFFAWAMAAGYMLFCVFFARHVHVHNGWIVAYTALLLGISVWNYMYKFRHFWAAQMAFFLLTSLMMGLAAYKMYPAGAHLSISPREGLLLGTGVMAPALGYVFSRERCGKYWSISLHASAHRSTVWVFGAALLAAAALLAVYFEGWLIPKYDYGVALRYALRAAITCLALLAAIPHYEGKWQGRVHVAISWAMVVIMPVILLLHALENLGTMGGYLVLLAIAIQATLFGIFWGIKGMHERFALLQSIFIAVFFAAIAVLGYL